MASAAEQELQELNEDLEELKEVLEERKAALAATRRRVASERALAATVLPPLPSDAVELIFSLLPVDVRLRCREVSRAWRAFLELRRLWHVCNLSGVARCSASLLRAASARAGGQLRVLDVSTWESIDWRALTTVAAENAASLNMLHVGGCCEPSLLMRHKSVTAPNNMMYAVPSVSGHPKTRIERRMKRGWT